MAESYPEAWRRRRGESDKGWLRRLDEDAAAAAATAGDLAAVKAGIRALGPEDKRRLALWFVLGMPDDEAPPAPTDAPKKPRQKNGG
jgi:hypothetical protein